MSFQEGAPREFSLERLLRLGEIERWHFWFVARRVQVARTMCKYVRGPDAHILDLGCGTGYMLQTLTQQGYSMFGLDLRPEGLEATLHVLPQARILQAQAIHLPFREKAFDAVILLDVLEHVDDRVLGAELDRILRPGGYAILTVPALPWLWSYRDEVAGHQRRYTHTQLARVLTSARLHVDEMRYYQAISVPLMLVTRVVRRSSRTFSELEEQPHPLFNRLMNWMNRIEAKLGDIVPLPWGSSLIVVCHKEL